MKKILIIFAIVILITPITCSAQGLMNGGDYGPPPTPNAGNTNVNSTNPAGSTGVNSTNPTGGTTVNSNTGSNPTPTSHLQNPLTKVTSIGDLVKSGLQVFSYIAVLFAVMMLIVVGFQYIMARGNPEAVTKASMWLLYIVIGLAIVIGARIAVTIVINTMSATGVVDPNVIQSAQNANSIN